MLATRDALIAALEVAVTAFDALDAYGMDVVGDIWNPEEPGPYQAAIKGMALVKMFLEGDCRCRWTSADECLAAARREVVGTTVPPAACVFHLRPPGPSDSQTRKENAQSATLIEAEAAAAAAWAAARAAAAADQRYS